MVLTQLLLLYETIVLVDLIYQTSGIDPGGKQLGVGPPINKLARHFWILPNLSTGEEFSNGVQKPYIFLSFLTITVSEIFVTFMVCLLYNCIICQLTLLYNLPNFNFSGADGCSTLGPPAPRTLVCMLELSRLQFIRCHLVNLQINFGEVAPKMYYFKTALK